MALESDSLLLLHVAPWSFSPVRRCGDGVEAIHNNVHSSGNRFPREARLRAQTPAYL